MTACRAPSRTCTGPIPAPINTLDAPRARIQPLGTSGPSRAGQAPPESAPGRTWLHQPSLDPSGRPGRHDENEGADAVPSPPDIHNGLIEPTIWQLPEPNPERPHGLKYRSVYAWDPRRLVGYDNERGTGDHRHLAGGEEPYAFVDVRELLRDFWPDVRRLL